MTRKRRVGVIGSIVWDVIYGRDTRSSPIAEWGGISYALSGMDAALSDEWEIVPIIKVGEDLAPAASQFMSGMRRMSSDARPIVVPYPNNRVELRYFDDERRSEVMHGGVPPWTWLGLKPVLETARLDALYINFLSGWELDLDTTMLVRQSFAGPIYCDLHMLAWAVQPDGLRTLRPISNVREWCGCFDVVQVNEDEMRMLAADPMALAATALHAGVRCLVVTLAKRGAVYFAAADFERLELARPASPRPFQSIASDVGPMRTSIVPADHVVDGGDPTGCGDVWGATYFSRLLAGDNFGDAILAAHRAAARNVGHRGASGLSDYLRGTISLT
ncbi:MAG TPA: carbohydrate kinase family protein [Gemmatimonadaceae bacterium]|nr:carbohydrate kinase family protein [Gemmatimonadaceae bacterium]